MALIEWKDAYRVGIDDIDHEHRGLIDLINALYDELGAKRDRDAVLDFLGEIFARVSAHFALEEQLMRARRYDRYAEHKADHERLLDDIREIMDMCEDAPGNDFDAELGARLERWFGDHFRTEDARLHKFLG